MLKKSLISLMVVCGVAAAFDLSANDKIRISGFGSIVGGTVLDGDGYWARLPEAAGQYVDGIEFQSESRLGLQANYNVANDFAITGQVMFRGINDFEPTLEWFYGTYNVTAESQVKFGQMRLPVYHFSDYMDVGVAYPWLRVPSDAYSLAFTNYQGVTYDINFDFDIGTTLLRVYAGQQATDPNKLITTIEQYKTEQLIDVNGDFRGVRGVRTTKDYKDLLGVVIDTNIDEFSFRASYLTGQENFTFYAEGDYPSMPLFGGDWVDTEFLDLSIQYDNGSVFAIAEWNNYKDIYTSWFTSFAYRTGKFTPYVFYSNFEGDFRFIAPGGISNGFEDGVTGSLDDNYNTLGLGLRYNLNPGTAFKFELLTFNDEGDAAVFIDEDQDGDTDSTALFFSLDFAF